MTALQEVSSGRTLLLHAHPGHELRLFGWMERHQPRLFLMTDGSGGGALRTSHSLETVHRAGAHAGSAFGMAADRDWYAAILNADLTMFHRMIGAIVQAATEQASTLIVSDAVDGYNPMHDLCEAVAASAASALRRQGQGITHLVARAVSGGDDGDIVAEIQVDGEARRRKQAAIEAYAPLAEEVRRLLDEEPAVLSTEQLRCPAFAWGPSWSPSWEKVGASRVATRKYAQRIEYTRHVRPLALALLNEHESAGAVESVERFNCAS